MSRGFKSLFLRQNEPEIERFPAFCRSKCVENRKLPFSGMHENGNFFVLKMMPCKLRSRTGFVSSRRYCTGTPVFHLPFGSWQPQPSPFARRGRFRACGFPHHGQNFAPSGISFLQCLLMQFICIHHISERSFDFTGLKIPPRRAG